jgi:hypothetical protein
MKRSYFLSFPMRAVLCAALLLAAEGTLCAKLPAQENRYTQTRHY